MKEMQVFVLDLLLDDHFALWDLAASFPSLHPASPDSAVSDLVELVRMGFVNVTFGQWFENETNPVSTERAEKALRDPSAWESTGREPGYVVELTDRGTEHLRTLGVGLPNC